MTGDKANGYIKYIIQTMVVLILVGLGAWNLKVTVDLKTDFAILKANVNNHESWGIGVARDAKEDISAQGVRIYRIELELAKGDRFTRKDGRMLEDGLKDWTYKYFIRK